LTPARKADHGRWAHAQPCGDSISGRKPMPRMSAPGRRRFSAITCNGVVPIRLEDAARPGGADTMAVQEDMIFAHHLFWIAQAWLDPPWPRTGPMPATSPSAARAPARSPRTPIAERRTELAGVDRADAPADHPSRGTSRCPRRWWGPQHERKEALNCWPLLPAVQPRCRSPSPIPPLLDFGGHGLTTVLGPR